MAGKLELITQGAEGRIFSSQWLGCDVIIKQRFKKKYRHPDLDSHITRERMKAEAKTLVRCRMLGINVPVLYDVNMSSNEIVLGNISPNMSVRKFIKDLCQDSSALLSLAEKIGKIISKLHVNDIIHGDLTTSNMLLYGDPHEKMALYLIDFGLSYMSEQVEDKAVDLYVLERAILSTHPNSKYFNQRILDEYAEEGGQKGKDVIMRLDDVRQRGRKKLCFG